MTRIYLPLIFSFALLFQTGCGVSRPANMPETAPCSITVQKDGVSISDVEVTLHLTGGNGSMLIRGKTDGTGVAKISTSWGDYKTDGAPVGVCKITLDKYFETPNPPKVMEDEPSWSPAQWEKYERDYNDELDKRRIIPKNLTDSATSPFEVEISPKTSGTITVDIGKSAR